MDFSDALRAVKNGQTVRRAYWTELGEGWDLKMMILSSPDGRPVLPMLTCSLKDGSLGKFAGGDLDILAEDWELVPPDGSEA